MSRCLTYMMSNGLQLVHYPQAGRVSYCGFIVNAGSREERPDEYGLAHLVEHTIFKGTTRRRACHIRNRM